MEHLNNLQKLYLYGNQIQEIRGLEHLVHLKELNLADNPIKEDERHLIERWTMERTNTQKIVKYCQEKAKKAQEGD